MEKQAKKKKKLLIHLRFYFTFSYLTPESDRKKHHIEVVVDEVAHHPERYPDIKPLDHPSPTEAKEEARQFDKKYHLPQEPKPHIDPKSM